MSLLLSLYPATRSSDRPVLCNGSCVTWHVNVAAGVESRLRAFGTSKLQLYQSLQERGQAQQKTLVEARAAKVKARATYCKANTEYAHCQLLKRPAQKQTEANTKMMDSRSLYSASIDHLNKVEVRAAKGLRRILEELHRMELERLALTREMMVRTRSAALPAPRPVSLSSPRCRPGVLLCELRSGQPWW